MANIFNLEKLKSLKVNTEERLSKSTIAWTQKKKT